MKKFKSTVVRLNAGLYHRVTPQPFLVSIWRKGPMKLSRLAFKLLCSQGFKAFDFSATVSLVVPLGLDKKALYSLV